MAQRESGSRLQTRYKPAVKGKRKVFDLAPAWHQRRRDDGEREREKEAVDEWERRGEKDANSTKMLEKKVSKGGSKMFQLPLLLAKIVKKTKKKNTTYQRAPTASPETPLTLSFFNPYFRMNPCRQDVARHCCWCFSQSGLSVRCPKQRRSSDYWVGMGRSHPSWRAQGPPDLLHGCS